MVSIDIKKLIFSINDNKIINNLNLELSNFNSYAIIGPSAIGKSTLLKCILGSVDYKGEIVISNASYSYKNKAIPTVSLVTETDEFIEDSLREELEYVLAGRGLREKDFDFLINEVVHIFKLGDFIDKEFNKLNYREQMISRLLVKAITKPDLLLVDDLFKYLDKKFKVTFIKYLLGNNITLINVISDMNDSLYTEYVVCLLKGCKVGIEGSTMGAIKEEKLLRRVGLELPFMIDLSIQLGCYELINKIYLNKEELVNDLWK